VGVLFCCIIPTLPAFMPLAVPMFCRPGASGCGVLGVAPHIVSTQKKLLARCAPALRAQEKSICVDEAAVRAQEFSMWLHGAGVDTNIELSNFGELRGTRATKPISKGEPILSYPRAVTMDMASLSGCPCAHFVDEAYWKGSPWYVQLALWLLSEEAKGLASEWSPYIALLPRTISVPLDWTDVQLEMLAYPSLINGIKKQRKESPPVPN